MGEDDVLGNVETVADASSHCRVQTPRRAVEFGAINPALQIFKPLSKDTYIQRHQSTSHFLDKLNSGLLLLTHVLSSCYYASRCSL